MALELFHSSWHHNFKPFSLFNISNRWIPPVQVLHFLKTGVEAKLSGLSILVSLQVSAFN
jgi:hypothetical protein